MKLACRSRGPASAGSGASPARPAQHVLRLPAARKRARAAALRDSAGFTLMEILIVLVILGLSVGVVSISWEALVPRQKLNGAVRELASTLTSTRTDAITRSAEFHMMYDLDANRYWVSTPYQLGGGFALRPEDRLRVYETDLTDKDLELSQVVIDDVVYNDGQVFVRMTPMGNASGHTVVIYHPQFNANHTIEVLPLTGLIRHHEGVFEREPPREGDFD